MGLFLYDEAENGYTAEINGVKIFCEDIKEGYEEKAVQLAEAYAVQLSQLVEYIAEEICDTFGYMSNDEIAEGLGTPVVDLDKEMVTYLEQTLDEYHIIDVEFGGMFDEFFSVSIDG